MKKTCLIISGGDFSMPPEEIVNSAELVVACDSGYKHAERMLINPHVIVGDFDSAEKPDKDIPIMEFPSRKDDTDTMLAVKYALDEGCNDIHICCALGGRMDHTFANIQSGAYIAKAAAFARIYGDGTEIAVFSNDKLVIPRREGWSFSVFSLADKSKGVSIKGAKYEITGADVVNTFPWGQSNLCIADFAEVSVDDGMLVVIQSKLKIGEHI